MKVCLEFLGCRLNESELQSWAEEFSKQGLMLTTKAQEASVIVLNTCAVTGEAARKSRQHLRKLHRSNPVAKLVATGCYASLEPEKVAEILGVDLVVTNPQKQDLVSMVFDQIELPEMPSMATDPGESAIFSRNRDRAFIKVQDGCRYRCTYCIVTVARGDERSRTIEEIVNEVNQHYRQGIREIVLTGVHVGGYGSDIDSDLYHLVQQILRQTKIPRIRFASVEPWDLPENFFKLFEDKRLMPHMHLPLQSGCNSVLRRMSRRCKTEEFAALIAKAKTLIPEFNVTTDIIVGFPGETDEEWEQTQDFVKLMNFGHIHIFSYSNREGTKAARLPQQIDANTKKTRSQQLHKMAIESTTNQLEQQLGKQCEVLLESGKEQLEDGRFRYWGHTPNYYKICLVDHRDDLGSQIVIIDITGIHAAGSYLETALVAKISDPEASLKHFQWVS